MQVKNVVSNVLVDFVLELEKAVSQGYKVVPESVAFESGYWKTKTEKEGVVEVKYDPANTVVIVDGEKIEINADLVEIKQAEIKPLELPEEAKIEVVQKPKRGRK